MVYNILSLCDGISTGAVAMQKAGKQYSYYIASEIDKHCIKATRHNFPAIIQIGDICSVEASKIPVKIDLLLSGTPCTGFSFAGKQLNFDDPRSQLFFQFVRVLAQLRKKNPDLKFLFENVMMDKKSEAIITTMLGVEPIRINSSLVCAQNRQRLYWQNIIPVPEFEQPEDRGIILQDILEISVDEKYYLSEAALARINKDAVLKQLTILKLQAQKSHAIISSVGSPTDREFLHHNQGQLVQVVAKTNNSQDGKNFAISGKSQCLSAGHNNVPKVAIQNDVAIITHNMMSRSSKSGKGGTGQVTRTDGKSYCLDTGKTNAIQIIQLNPSTDSNSNQPYYQHRVYDANGIAPSVCALEAHTLNVAVGVDNSNGILRQVYNDKALSIDANYVKGMDNHGQRTLVAVCNKRGKLKPNQSKSACFTAGGHSGGNHSDMDVVVERTEQYLIIRRLTPTEVARLQGMPDDYLSMLSDSQQYKAYGNGWQSDTVAHILSYLP